MVSVTEVRVLLSFGLILLLNEAQRIIFGSDAHSVSMPKILDYSIRLTDTFAYPLYRVFACVIGVLFVAAMHLIMARTRIGMMLRAGAENRDARLLRRDVNENFVAHAVLPCAPAVAPFHTAAAP